MEKRAELIKELEIVESMRDRSRRRSLTDAGWDGLVGEYDTLAQEKAEFRQQKTELLKELVEFVHKKYSATDRGIRESDLAIASDCVGEEIIRSNHLKEEVSHIRDAKFIDNETNELYERERKLLEEQLRTMKEKEQIAKVLI